MMRPNPRRISERKIKMAYNDQQLRTMMTSFYMMQDMRIRTNNRIAGMMFTERAIERGDLDAYGNVVMHKEERDDEAHAKMILNMIEYQEKLKNEWEEAGKHPTRNSIIKILQTRKGPISNIAVWSLVEDLIHYMDREKWYMGLVQAEVKQHPVFQQFLSKVPYCGTMMSAVILSSFDIRKARHMSGFWKYAGLDAVIDPTTGKGVGRSRTKVLMEETTYIDANGNEATRKSIGFNPRLQTKLLGVLAPLFIKYNTVYRKFYDDAKHRYTERAKVMGEDVTPMQISRRAIRFMMKVFVQDLWVKWREIEGYPVEPSYYEVYLAGRPHGRGYMPGVTDEDGNYLGKKYDPNSNENETKNITARHLLQMRIMTDEEAELFTGVSADELLRDNYQDIDDIYNRAGEHKKRPKI